MKKLAFIALSPLVLVSMAFAGGQNAPAYSHPKPAKPHHHEARPFSGIAVTGAIGGIAGEANVKQSFDGENIAGVGAILVDPGKFPFSVVSPVSSSATAELFESNVAGMAAIEAAFQFRNGFVLGVAGTAGFNNVQFDNTLSVVNDTFVNDEDTDDEFSNTTEVTSSVRIKLDNDFAFLFKPGFVVRKNTMFYALIGPRWGNFHTKLYDTDSLNGGTEECADIDPSPECGFGWQNEADSSASHSDYQLGVTAGLGVRQVVSNHFLIGLEYAYTHYGDLDALSDVIDAPLLGEDATCLGGGVDGAECADSVLNLESAAKDISVRTHTVMGTLSYRF